MSRLLQLTCWLWYRTIDMPSSNPPPGPPASLRSKLAATLRERLEKVREVEAMRTDRDRRAARNELADQIAEAVIETVRLHIAEHRVNPCTPRDFEGMIRESGHRI